jgi:hypothetical protein
VAASSGSSQASAVSTVRTADLIEHPVAVRQQLRPERFDQAIEAFYRRRHAHAGPALRGWLHLLWFEASLVLGTLLVVRARRRADYSAGHLRGQRERHETAGPADPGR